MSGYDIHNEFSKLSHMSQDLESSADHHHHHHHEEDHCNHCHSHPPIPPCPPVPICSNISSNQKIVHDIIKTEINKTMLKPQLLAIKAKLESFDAPYKSCSFNTVNNNSELYSYFKQLFIYMNNEVGQYAILLSYTGKRLTLHIYLTDNNSCPIFSNKLDITPTGIINHNENMSDIAIEHIFSLYANGESHLPNANEVLLANKVIKNQSNIFEDISYNSRLSSFRHTPGSAGITSEYSSLYQTPVITSISPSTVSVYGLTETLITVTGYDFYAPIVQTTPGTFTDTTWLTDFSITGYLSANIGTTQIFVSNQYPSELGTTAYIPSNVLPLTVNGNPYLQSITPSEVFAPYPQVIMYTLKGNGFVNNSVVTLSATNEIFSVTYVSATELICKLTTTYIGKSSITVSNNYGTTTGLSLNIQPLIVSPSTVSVSASPATIVTITGVGFSPNGVQGTITADYFDISLLSWSDTQITFTTSNVVSPPQEYIFEILTTNLNVLGLITFKS